MKGKWTLGFSPTRAELASVIDPCEEYEGPGELKRHRIVRLRREGHSYAAIAHLVGTNEGYVWRVLKCM